MTTQSSTIPPDDLFMKSLPMFATLGVASGDSAL